MKQFNYFTNANEKTFSMFIQTKIILLVSGRGRGQSQGMSGYSKGRAKVRARVRGCPTL